jgi:hypothetical protein
MARAAVSRRSAGSCGRILVPMFSSRPRCTGDIARFATPDRFAAYTGTAPIEASTGPHKIYRLSRRGNRQLNHAIHIAAVTQIRNRRTDRRAYYDRRVAEGKSPKMALRALKRRISDALYKADRRRPARQTATRGQEPARATGERLCFQRRWLTPRTPTLRTSHSLARSPAQRHAAPDHEKPRTDHHPKRQPAVTIPSGVLAAAAAFASGEHRRTIGQTQGTRQPTEPKRLTTKWPRYRAVDTHARMIG